MIWLAIPALAAAAYYCLAIVAAATWRARSANSALPPATPALSILKPVHGRDPQFYEAILSHAAQDYPEFEILFGATNPDDPALQDIRRLQREFPGRRIELAIVRTDAPNAKVGVLAELARRARYPLLLVNDSDIVVEPGYFRAVTAPLARSGRSGMVTCLYRAAAESWASRCEALGIATEFAPSVLVARLLGVAEFALGSTMAFRARSPGAHRRLRRHRQLPGRRLPVGAPHRAVGTPHRVRAGGGGDRSRRRFLGARPGGTSCAGRAPSAYRALRATTATW